MAISTWLTLSRSTIARKHMNENVVFLNKYRRYIERTAAEGGAWGGASLDSLVDYVYQSLADFQPCPCPNIVIPPPSKHGKIYILFVVLTRFVILDLTLKLSHSHYNLFKRGNEISLSNTVGFTYTEVALMLLQNFYVSLKLMLTVRKSKGWCWR